MTVAPCEPQGISPDRLDVLQQDQQRDIVGLEAQLAGPFIRARRARAMLAQVTDRIHALVAVTPDDAEHALVDPLHVLRLKHGRRHMRAISGRPLVLVPNRCRGPFGRPAPLLSPRGAAASYSTGSIYSGSLSSCRRGLLSKRTMGPCGLTLSDSHSPSQDDVTIRRRFPVVPANLAQDPFSATPLHTSSRSRSRLVSSPGC